MTNYLANIAGASYFFTVNLADRSSDLLVRNIDDLRVMVNTVKARHPFAIHAMVVFPNICIQYGVYQAAIPIIYYAGR
jgi:putative transposase